MRIHLLLSIFLVGGLLAIPQARAAQSFEGCSGFIDSIPAVISTQGVWCLRSYLSSSLGSGALIRIDTNNVTIDCNDFKLGGLGAGTGTLAIGIGANGDRSNATVRNCNIRGFLFGVAFDAAGTTGALIEDNRFEANRIAGIVLAGQGHIARRNRVSDTGGSPYGNAVGGIQIQAFASLVEDNTIVSTTSDLANASPSGIIVGGDGNVVRRNFVAEVVPTGSGSARGIHNLGAANLFEHNVISNPAPVPGYGILTGSAGKCIDNRVINFQTSSIDGCTGGGGNQTF